jgi:hypothetical protein
MDLENTSQERRGINKAFKQFIEFECCKGNVVDVFFLTVSRLVYLLHFGRVLCV